MRLLSGFEVTNNDGQDLSGSGVSMRRVDSPWCIVNTNHGDSEGVEPWQLGYGNRGDPRAVRVGGIPWNVQPAEGKVVGPD